MKVLQTIAACGFVICLPILLITSNIRFMVSETRLYEYGFNKYGISEVTGIENDELNRAARELIDYFNSKEDSAQIKVLKGSEEIDLFSEREIAHLRDVKGLIQLCYLTQRIALAYVLIYILLGFIWHKSAFLQRMTQVVFFGGMLTIAFFASIGIWAVIDFEGLFLAFHLASFQNELWMLDPSRHYLIMMFPEGFFFDAALFLVGGIVAEAAILSGGTGAYLRSRKKGS